MSGDREARDAPPTPMVVGAELASTPTAEPPAAKGQTMEIHPPERPIHSVKDFLLALTTITIGILIALSLEGVVEWAHHRALVREAKGRLAQEIQENAREVKGFLKAVPVLKESREQTVRFIDDLLGPKQQKGSITFRTSYNIMSLATTSWSTAQATGAVAYMDYADAQKYAGAFDLQARLSQLQDLVLRTYVTGGQPMQDPNDKRSDAELLGWKQNLVTIGRYMDAEQQLAEALLKEYDKILK